MSIAFYKKLSLKLLFYDFYTHKLKILCGKTAAPHFVAGFT